MGPVQGSLTHTVAADNDAKLLLHIICFYALETLETLNHVEYVISSI